LRGCDTVSNETSFLNYFMRYIRKWNSSLKETFEIRSKIQRNVKFIYFNLFGTVCSVSEWVSNETRLLSYFMRYIRIWSFSLKETFQILSTLQRNIKLLHFNVFDTVCSDSGSVLNETSLLSYFVLYVKKWSFSLKETFEIHSKIQRNVKFLYFNSFGTVCSDSESVSNETTFHSYFVRYIRKCIFSLKKRFKFILRYKETSNYFILTYLT